MVCCKGDGKQALFWALATSKAAAWMHASDFSCLQQVYKVTC